MSFKNKIKVDFPIQLDDIILSYKDKSLPSLDNSYIYENL